MRRVFVFESITYTILQVCYFLLFSDSGPLLNHSDFDSRPLFLVSLFHSLYIHKIHIIMILYFLVLTKLALA